MWESNRSPFDLLTCPACCWFTILSVANGSGKISVHGRTYIEYQGTDQVTGVKRSKAGHCSLLEAAHLLGWAKRWRAENWMGKPTKPRKNADLWRRIIRMCGKHDVLAEWVRGHNGGKENECCDRLAKGAVREPNLSTDHGYKTEIAGR